MDSGANDRRAAFCARLKAARERQGVSLDEIAASTKINRALLKGLENNDLSRWPGGLYRRAYLRHYLTSIGHAEESTVAEFVQLFPEDPGTPKVEVIVPAAADDAPLSLTMANGPQQRLARLRARGGAILLDTAIVLLVWAAAAATLPIDAWASGAVIVFVYHTIGNAVFGRSCGTQWLDRRRWTRPRVAATPPLHDAPATHARSANEGLEVEQEDPSIAGHILSPLSR